jgi:hypothetical protein
MHKEHVARTVPPNVRGVTSLELELQHQHTLQAAAFPAVLCTTMLSLLRYFFHAPVPAICLVH